MKTDHDGWKIQLTRGLPLETSCQKGRRLAKERQLKAWAEGRRHCKENMRKAKAKRGKISSKLALPRDV